MIIDAAGVAVLIGLMLLVVRDTRRRSGRWGVNTSPVICPRCGEPTATFRVPRSISQALWGGRTCSCGCKMDKWGRETP